QANRRFCQAFLKKDAATVAGMYTSDAILFPPDADMIRGRKAIGEFWKGMMGGVKNVTLTTVDLGASGDVAYESGKASITVQPAGGQSTPMEVKYVVVWKRQKDGSWKLHRDIWNNLAAAK